MKKNFAHEHKKNIKRLVEKAKNDIQKEVNDRQPRHQGVRNGLFGCGDRCHQGYTNNSPSRKGDDCRSALVTRVKNSL